MALIRLNNQSISSVTALPSGIDTGKVLQVVQGTYADSGINTTSTSYVDTGLDVNITPSSSSNKVLVLATFQGQTSGNTVYSIFRDSTNLLGDLGFARLENTGKQTAFSLQFLDSPSSLSELNYEVKYKTYVSGTSTFHPQGSDTTAMIQAIEIEV